MDFRTTVLESLTPVVMVVASTAVEQAVQSHNGLTLTDVLRPSGFFRHLTVPIQTVNDTTIRIREFRLRFFAADTVVQPSQEVADEHLRALLTEAVSRVQDEPVPDIRSMLLKGEVQRSTPWFDAYKAEFMRMLLFNDHETFDHPLACLVAVGTDEADPVKAAAALSRGAPQPPLLQAGIADSRAVQRHFLLVHDASSGISRAEADRSLEAMRATYGKSSCGLIVINSNVTQQTDGSDTPSDGQTGSGSGRGRRRSSRGYEALWRAHMGGTIAGGGAGEPAHRPAVPGQGLGAGLAESDIVSVKAALEEFLLRSLLPWLQARVRTLYNQVLAARKGLRSQFKALLGMRKASGVLGASEATTRPSSAAGKYDASSPQLQMRALADCAFMLQDFETAATAAQFAASDFRTERAWKHYAGAMELQGIIAAVIAQRPSDVNASFREAFVRYTSAAGSQIPAAGVRLATRTMLLLAAYSMDNGAPAAASDALMSAHYHEEDLRSAVLLEQAAVCMLATTPPQARKFAFHMVLSGLRYSNCGQTALVVRAYKQVLSVYEGRHWTYIEEHLHKVLGETAQKEGDLASAVEHYAAVLPAAAPAAWQTARLATFLDAVQKLALQQGSPVGGELKLPAVNTSSIKVHFDDARCAGNPAACSVPDATWKKLEAGFAPPGADTTSWMDAAALRTAGGPSTIGTCVAGESVCVDVEVFNPLQIGLDLSQLKLICELRANPMQAKQQGQQADGATMDGESTETSLLQAVAAEHKMRLRGGERCLVRLESKPQSEGLLKLLGIEWALNGTALGRRDFTPRPPLRKGGGAARGTDAKSPALSLAVMPVMPRLEAHLKGLPPTLLAGELACCTLRLHNSGGGALHGLRLAGGPSLYLARAASDVTADALQMLNGSSPAADVMTADEVAVEQFRSGQQMFVFSGGGHLDAGADLEWPLWVHPQSAGDLDLHYVVYYEPVRPVEGMKYRCLRMAHSITVLPSVSCQSSLRPSAVDLNRNLLHLLIQNLQSSARVTLDRITLTSQGWGVSHLPSPTRSRQKPTASSDRVAPHAAREALDLQVAILPGESSAAILVCHPSLRHQPATSAVATSGSSAMASSPFDVGPPSPRGPADNQSVPAGSQSSAAVTQGPVQAFHRRSAARVGSRPAPSSRGMGAGLSSYDGSMSAAAMAAADSDGLSAIIAWSSSSPLDRRPHRGFLHLHHLRLEDRTPVRAVARCPRAISHDFSSGRPCIVTVTLDMLNCLQAPASLAVEAGPAPRSSPTAANTLDSESLAWQVDAPALATAGIGGETSTVQQDLSAAPPVVWCGHTRATIASLLPGQLATIQLQLALLAPGTYQIDDYVISWTFRDLSGLHDTRPGPTVIVSATDLSPPDQTKDVAGDLSPVQPLIDLTS